MTYKDLTPELFQHAAANSALDVLVGPTDKVWRLLAWRISLGAAGGAGDAVAVAVKNVNSGNTSFNLPVDGASLNSVTYVNHVTPIYFSAGEQANFTWTNSGGKSYGLEVFYEECHNS